MKADFDASKTCKIPRSNFLLLKMHTGKLPRQLVTPFHSSALASRCLLVSGVYYLYATRFFDCEAAWSSMFVMLCYAVAL